MAVSRAAAMFPQWGFQVLRFLAAVPLRLSARRSLGPLPASKRSRLSPPALRREAVTPPALKRSALARSPEQQAWSPMISAPQAVRRAASPEQALLVRLAARKSPRGADAMMGCWRIPREPRAAAPLRRARTPVSTSTARSRRAENGRLEA